MKRMDALWVYESLVGSLTAEYRCREVENLFGVNQTCTELYSQMLEAYWRICARLGQDEEDADGEIMINSLLDIMKIVGLKMFEYGQQFGK